MTPNDIGYQDGLQGRPPKPYRPELGTDGNTAYMYGYAAGQWTLERRLQACENPVK